MKKILFCLMILIIGICLISASYAISQENNTIGSTLPQSESHTIQSTKYASKFNDKFFKLHRK